MNTRRVMDAEDIHKQTLYSFDRALYMVVDGGIDYHQYTSMEAGDVLDVHLDAVKQGCLSRVHSTLGELYRRGELCDLDAQAGDAFSEFNDVLEDCAWVAREHGHHHVERYFTNIIDIMSVNTWW